MVTLDTEHQILFQKGTEVEVTSDEEGFKGAWYRAIILESVPKSTSKKRKKAHVEYKSLVTEDGSGPLTEYIDSAYVRPLPPQEDSTNEVFEVNDVVDAFYRDGWWTGTVRKILEDGKYRVYFDNPPDLLEFEGKDLRAHWDWNDGNWVRAGKEQSTGSIFSSGTEVEVNVENKENLRDIWFPAIVIKEIVDGTFFVKYLNSRNGDEAATVRVTLDSQHIRPTPPRYLDRKYELLEKVDTYDGIGWRAGVITKVLTGGSYNVFFKHGNEDKELSHSDIRPHMEWSNGSWIGKSKEVIASDNQEQLGPVHDATANAEVAPKLKSSGSAKDITEDIKPCLTNIRKNPMETSTPCHEDSASHPLPPNKRKMRLSNSYNTGMHSCPNKKLRENSLSFTPVQLKNMPNKTTEETPSVVATPKTERKQMRCPRKPVESPVLGKRIRTSQHKFGVDFQTEDLSKRKARPTKLQIKRPPSKTGKESDARVAAAEVLNESNGKEKVAETSVVVGLKAKEVRGSQAGSPSLISNEESLKLIRDQYKNSNDSDRDNSTLPKGGGSSQRRKRGRPRKLVIMISKASEDGKEHKESAGAADEIVVKDCIANEAEMHGLKGVESTVVGDASGERMGEVPKTDCLTKEVDKVVAVASNNVEDDDRPLSAWIGGGTHSSNGEELRLSSTNTVNGLNEERKSQNDIVMESSTIGTQGGSAPVKNQMLPFAKKSPIWKTIESMEVFQIVPQKPHFIPLSETKEEYREGSAIGIMVTFAGLFEKINMLKCDDSMDVFASTLDSLLDLEKHGFDVTLLRKRVDELLPIRNKQGQLMDDLKDAERGIIKHTDERTKLDEEVEAIKKKIIELQEQLESTKLRKEKKIAEIVKLRSRTGSLNVRIRNTQLDFEKVAAAGWKLS
ncbi:hypothetical protein Dsin_025641 [Dipteronia sinensis]|uniref:Agenet domain-containing protein n=1 Tax=Dipteronia sinensis TaxID=43782 RepID=A0AAD9ZWS0_9ROSI|nr:hypothetical protein Dsin_025641 [Dipteronia sinensis]